jgi:hypothetical protein
MEKGVGGLLEFSREQHFTVVLLANANPNAYVSCSLILKLPPLYHTACLLLLIKNLTSCTSRTTNLSKTVQRTAMRAPTRTPQESEDLTPYNTPCQQEAAKKSTLHPIPDPQPLPSSLLKKKWGNDTVIMLPFYQWPFYPQASLLEKWSLQIAPPPKAVPPLTEIPVF